MYATDLTINGAQTLQNALDDVEVGSTLSYQLCKELYLKHPLGAKLVDLPIDKGLMTKREILIQDAPPEVIEQFEKTWKNLKANRAIEMAVRNSRIYGTGSIAIVFKDPEIKPSANMRWELCQNQQFAFNALDPLNTSGTGVLTQNPTDYDFQEIHGVMVSGVNYHHSRTFQVVNECPVYLSWTASAFGFTGRSVYTRAIYPLKSFISTMIADDMVAQKVGVMIQKTEKSGSVIDGLMQKIGAIKRSFLKIASTGNVLEVGLKDSIETLNMTGIDSALNAVRKNILENIASSDKMPALLMLSETFATGFGEGSEDAKQISAYLDNFREKHAPLYDWMDKVVRKTAWTPEFYATIQARYPAEYGNKPYFVAIKQWHDNFSYEWESLIKEPESEAVNVESVKFKAVTDLMGIVFDKLDPANQSAFLKFCESNLNESTKLFPNKLELDFDAYEQHQQEQQAQAEQAQQMEQQAQQPQPEQQGQQPTAGVERDKRFKNFVPKKSAA